jgi:hypothetical protein
MPREPVLPDARAAMFAAVCLALGAAAHRVMSDTAIPLWAMILGGVGAYVPARVGTRRECGLLEITLLMGVLQVALHSLFSYAQHVSVESMSPMSMPTGMTMPGMGVDRPMGTGMLIGHALAALACAWWLRRGEAAVHALVRSAARWIVERFATAAYVVPADVRGRVVFRVEPVALALRSQWLRVCRTLRGPPRSPSYM